MPIYEYRCDHCRTIMDSTHRGDTNGPCPMCLIGTMRRKFAVAMQRPMQEHFNHTVNKPISSMRQFRDELAKASDDYFQRTGIESKFVPRDWGQLGATEEGLDAASKTLVDSGKKQLILPSDT